MHFLFIIQNDLLTYGDIKKDLKDLVLSNLGFAYTSV